VAEAPLAKRVFQVDEFLGELVEVPVTLGIAIHAQPRRLQRVGKRPRGAPVALELPGVYFRPAVFEPTFQKHAGRACGGCQIHVTDRTAFRPVLTGAALAGMFHRADPARFAWRQPPYEYETTRLPNGPLLKVQVQQGVKLGVLGVEDRLVQVMRNLIANAQSFSPPNGTILIKAGRTNGYVEVVVEDEGPGIPESKMTAIFDRFYTERPKGEKFGTHSGLGLSISKQIIEAHRGTIRAMNRYAEDDPKKVLGARFTVRLPGQ